MTGQQTTQIGYSVVCPHYRIGREDNVIFVYLCGTWEGLISKRFIRDFEKIRKPLEHSHWAVIYHTKDWIVGTPEFQTLILALAKDNLRLGQAASAKIITPNALKAYQYEMLSKQINMSINEARFIEEEDAFHWLVSQGFAISLRAFPALTPVDDISPNLD